MTTCVTPLPYTPTISACGQCPTCCSFSVGKRPLERVPVCVPWHHRLDCGGPWTLKKVAHTVKMGTGASLAVRAYDPASAYALGDVVSFGARRYTAAGAVPAGAAPMPVNALWTDTGENLDLFVALDTDYLPHQWVDKQAVASHAILQGGEDDTDYRVEVMATFRDCEGREIELWDCVQVKVAKCD